MIANAPWAARQGHTSVIDAAGAIYVLGGEGDGATRYPNDVWASTDGGARPAKRYYMGTHGVLQGYQGRTEGYLAGT